MTVVLLMLANPSDQQWSLVTAMTTFWGIFLLFKDSLCPDSCVQYELGVVDT